MQAKMHIKRSEELALGITEERTQEVRNDFVLLNSDDLPLETALVTTNSAVTSYNKEEDMETK